MLDMVHFPRKLLSENVAPSFLQRQKAWSLGRQIKRSIKRRKAIIRARGLDAEFGLPAENWAEGPHNDFRKAVARLSTLEWSDIRHLRLMSQMFTGYCLRELRDAKGLPSVGNISNDFDDRWAQEDAALPDVTQWREVVAGIPERYRVNPPHMLGEIGWMADGVLVNNDTRVYQERITLMHQAGVLDKLDRLGRAPRILEIGGGYGALALTLRKAFPECDYVICDLPESLMFSGIYLSLVGQPVRMWSSAHSHPGISLLPNYLWPDLSGSHFDLAINTLSMSEMSAHQVRTYCNGLRDLLGSAGIFFEQNQDNTHMGLFHAQDIVSRIFPFRRQLGAAFEITQGVPNLWANTEAALP